MSTKVKFSENSEPATEFSNLEALSVFYYKKHYYIKIDKHHVIDLRDKDKSLCEFGFGFVSVEPVKATILIGA